jgi:hypothetical protein
MMQQPLEHTRSNHTTHSSTFPGAYARLSYFPAAPTSRTKAAIVTLLAWLLAWRPAVALVIGRLVLRVWPHFRRA